MDTISNPSILAAMAGITDGDFARYCLNEGGAGHVTVGGFSIGKEMLQASIESTRRGRKEFIFRPGEESKKIYQEVSKIQPLSKVFINLRINKLSEAKKFIFNLTDLLETNSPIIEINAHCRQREIMGYGGGQSLLQRIDCLEEIIKVFQSQSFRVSLKIRGNAISPESFIPKISKWQLDFLHIDSYKVGVIGTDLDLLIQYKNALDTIIIGNNSVIDQKSAQAILDTDIPYFSIARAAHRNPTIFNKILKNF